MGFLDFLTGKNPAKAAQPYLQQIPGAVQPYYQPYINQGQQSGSAASGIYNQMSSDPTAFLNQLMSGYTPSQGYQFQADQAQKAASNAAAAGGYRGTSFDQMQQAELANALASQDMYKWLEQVLGVQGVGLGGQQHLADQGFQASTGYGDVLGNTLGAQGGLAYQGQAQKNKQNADFLQLLSSLGGAAFGAASNPMSLFGKELW